MDLFNRNEYLTPEEIEKQERKKARERFTETNKDMTRQIQKKVIGHEKVYDKVHVEIYEGVGLGKNGELVKERINIKIQKRSLIRRHLVLKRLLLY